MIDNLNTQPSVTIDTTIEKGGYSASDNQIRIRNGSNLLNLTTVSAEVFHAYQQKRTLTLDDVQESSDFKGGPNFEFEEKFMKLVAACYDFGPGLTDPEGVPGLANWVFNLYITHGDSFPTTFNASEKQQYQTFMETFNQYWKNHNDPPKSYAAPIDYSMDMEPANVFDILNKSNC